MTLLKKIIKKIYKPFRDVNFSFSQEGEDIVLESLLTDLPNNYKGFYVDIGAHHPFRFSNTYLYYLKGWRGINIDPTPGCMKEFFKYRKRDINLQIGISNKNGKMNFYCFNEPALNTFDEQVANERKNLPNYHVIKTVEVQVARLKDVFDQYLHPNTKIDFISIDVEGLDKLVLDSNDWNKYRPNFLLVESVINGIENPEIGCFLEEKGYSKIASTLRTSIYKNSITHHNS
jgi:FkbM family methyltransferase